MSTLKKYLSKPINLFLLIPIPARILVISKSYITLIIFQFPVFLQVQDLEYVEGWKSYEYNEHKVANAWLSISLKYSTIFR